MLLKSSVLIMLFMMSRLLSISQEFECLTPNPEEDNLSLNLPAFCSDYNNYIPDPTNNFQYAPILTYRVNIHLFRRSDGSGVYQYSDTNAFKENIAWVNQFYAQIYEPVLPVNPPALYIHDSRIRFKLMKIYFHDSTAYYESNSGTACEATYYNAWGINKDKEINIFYYQNPNFSQGSGCASSTFVNMVSIIPSFAAAQLLAHELGHTLRLPHTGECPGSTCSNDNFDDTYSPDCNRAWLDCGENFTSSCHGDIGISNNLMGYNKCRSYLSPK